MLLRDYPGNRSLTHPTGENSNFKITYYSSVKFQFGPANCGFQDCRNASIIKIVMGE